MTQTQSAEADRAAQDKTEQDKPEFTKRLVIGKRQWGIADANAEETATRVKDAMTTGTPVTLEVCDPHEGHAVLVYLNGAATSSVEVDLLKGPRPSEMS